MDESSTRQRSLPALESTGNLRDKWRDTDRVSFDLIERDTKSKIMKATELTSLILLFGGLSLEHGQVHVEWLQRAHAFHVVQQLYIGDE